MIKSKIKPRGKNVLVIPDKNESKANEHGISMPSSVEEEPKETGKVVAIGPDVKDIKVGDKVMFATFAGDKIEMDKKKYVMLHDDDSEILATL